MSTNAPGAYDEPPATPAEIWEILRATARQTRETDRQMQDTDRQMKETKRLIQETSEQMKETDRRLKKAEDLFTTQWGKLMESLVEGDLVPLLQGRGIEVERTLERMKGRRNGEHIEIDLVAVNGAEVVVVEVKTTLRAKDVSRFVKKLPKFVEWAPEFRGRRVVGAVAYLRSDDSVIRQAARQGLFVIRATGSSASILNEPDFEPRVF